MECVTTLQNFLLQTDLYLEKCKGLEGLEKGFENFMEIFWPFPAITPSGELKKFFNICVGSCPSLQS